MSDSKLLLFAISHFRFIETKSCCCPKPQSGLKFLLPHCPSTEIPHMPHHLQVCGLISLYNPNRHELIHTSFPIHMRPRVNGPLTSSLTTFVGDCSLQTYDPYRVPHSATEKEPPCLCPAFRLSAFLMTHSYFLLLQVISMNPCLNR